jgi:fermentation-respiration switch protein FrsA (DUF1100 family)
MSNPQPASPPQTKPAAKSRLRRWIKYFLQVTILAYLGVCIIMFSIQDKFVFPGSDTQGQHDAILTPSYGYDLITLPTADGHNIAAIFGKALDPSGHPISDNRSRPTVIYFYGNGACMAYSTDVFDQIRRLDANIIIPEYEGYGMSPGKPSEAGCYAAADAAYQYALSRKDVDPQKIIAMGWSLGGAVAIDLASHHNVAGLITLSAFTSMPDMGRQLMPWLPVSLILKYKFDNATKLAGISCPTLIIHGTDDDIVPFSMAPKLAAAAKGKVIRYNVRGAGHNDIFDTGDGPLLDQIQNFLQQYQSPESHSAG